MEAVTALAAHRPLSLAPGETAVVLLAFEGPDRYSRRGSLGDQVAGLGTAFAAAEYATTVVFVGDPEAPHEESASTGGDGTLRLVRWGQWISRYFPGGPYEDEDARVHDYSEGVPTYLTQLDAVTALSPDPAGVGPRLVVIAHEWQTSGALLRLDRVLRERGVRHRALLVWTLRHLLNLAHVDLPALSATCSVTTVSRYLKHELWKHGLDPVVLPLGVDDDCFRPVAPELEESAAALSRDRLLLVASALPPDWESTVYAAIGALKHGGRRPLLVVGTPVPVAASALAGAPDLTFGALAGLDAGLAHTTADVLISATQLDAATMRALQGAATANLLLGGYDATESTLLSAMAAGAVCVTDRAMSDALVPFQNGVGLETRTTAELVATLVELDRDSARLQAIRAGARATAEGYTWPRTLAALRVKLEFLAGAR
jgi:glycosyltransferase involved in cell wall biosynthesis